jgi:hypothetical protein
MSSGIYVRIMRGGVPMNLEAEQLTNQEREAWLNIFKYREALVRMIHVLCHALQERANEQ